MRPELSSARGGPIRAGRAGRAQGASPDAPSCGQLRPSPWRAAVGCGPAAADWLAWPRRCPDWL